MKRCTWADTNEWYIPYHDEEWGVPQHDDIKLFEAMVLDSFQAGLNWLMMLKKRENFRNAFANYDVKKIAAFGDEDVDRLLQDVGIIRNRQKITAAINNAQRYLEVQKEFGSFDKYIWQFTDHKTIDNAWTTEDQIPANSPLSDEMCKALQKRGFKFVGTTICYAFMQAVGMVNDHTVDCPRYDFVKNYSEK